MAACERKVYDDIIRKSLIRNTKVYNLIILDNYCYIFYSYLWKKFSKATVNIDESKLEEIMKKLLTETNDILDKKVSKLENSVNGVKNDITNIRKNLESQK